MPTKRTKRMRSIKNPEIDPAEIYFLEHGTSEGGPPYKHLQFEFFMRCKNENGWRDIWKKEKNDILADWIKKNPCTRPAAFWWYDAKERRQQVSGARDDDYDDRGFCLAADGLPEYWQSHWKITDPPVFESTAGNLQRLGLLTATEKKYLASHPELLEPETITYDESE